MTIDIRHYAFYTVQKGGSIVPKTIEEDYEEALKGYEHSSLRALCDRDPELRALVFSASLYERLHPEPAVEESEENKQPPTV